MEFRVLSFSILAAMLLMIRALANTSGDLHTDPLKACMSQNPEDILACGAKIPLAEADQFALELIPGISEPTAILILNKRDEILHHAAMLPQDEQYRALTKVRGIGLKKSKDLCRYIRFF